MKDYHVFICYSREDAPDFMNDSKPISPIGQILKCFKEAGIKPWIDREGKYVGENYHKEILKAIDNSEMMVFVSSANSNKSYFAIKEVCYAVENKMKIIPILLDKTPFNDYIELIFSAKDKRWFYPNTTKTLDDLVADVKKYIDDIARKEREKAEESERSKEREEKMRKSKEEEERNRIEKLEIEIAGIKKRIDEYGEKQQACMNVLESKEIDLIKLKEAQRLAIELKIEAERIAHEKRRIDEELRCRKKGEREEYKKLPPPPGCSYDNSHSRRDRVNDFAPTAVGPISNSMHAPKTYQPRVENTYDNDKYPKQSIWSKLFGRKQRNVKEKKVYSSVFAPAEIKLKSHLIVQVYLHLLEETEMVSRLAVESDRSALRRDYRPLQCKLKNGDKVDVQLNISGETLLMTEEQSLVWQGAFTKCSFDYFVPRNLDVEELSCMVLLSINGIPTGKISFTMKIVEEPRQLNPEIIAHTFNKVFISYAHKDEEKVKSFHEGLKLAGKEHFFDRAYLKTGDVFPQVIQDYINSADLFVLFWSENAAESEYVEKERKQALERAFPQVKPQQAAKLTIYPMSIEPRAELPSDMKDYYHFGEI